jgi:subtilisin family serine protease
MLNKLLLQRLLFLETLIKLEIQRRFQLIIAFIILFLTPVVFADVGELLASPPETLPSPTLEEKMNTPGSKARVIVELDLEAVNLASSTRDGDRSSLEEQTEQVAEVQGMFLDNLKKLMFSTATNPVKAQFNYVPGVVVEANQFLLEHIKRDPLVKSVVEDKITSFSLAESIPLIGADKTKLNDHRGNGQAVAIIDSGVDGRHRALKGKVIAEACFSTTDPWLGAKSLCPNRNDKQIGKNSAVPCKGIMGCDHGTHVAGIATANSKSITGVAPAADIVAIQVSSRFDNNALCGNLPCLLIYDSDILHALEHVLFLHNQDIPITSANLSLGSGYYFSPCDNAYPLLTSIIDSLRQVGIATVVASGNGWSGVAMSFPACISSAISVGATCDEDNIDETLCQDGKDSVAEFSNSTDFLDLLAPGIWTTSTVPRNAWGTKGGTSMSAPFVAGAWAVLKSANPDATFKDILTALRDTGKPILDWRNGLIKPRIQLDEAVQALIGPPDPPALAAILPNLTVVSDEQGFNFMWKRAAELSGVGMNLWCAAMDKDNHTFKYVTKINSKLKAITDKASYHVNKINGTKYCTLEEINAAGESTFHCDAAVVIGDEISVNITKLEAENNLEAAKALCRNLTR